MTAMVLYVIALALALATSVIGAAAIAQTNGLPAASRTVYKCVVDGKTNYSDAPCLGAQRIDVTPTRGMNKSTGRELTGADVNRERHAEMMSEAFRPITGMSVEEHAVATKRYRLSSEAKIECRALDQRLLLEETQDRAAGGTDKELLRRLLRSRSRFREIGC